MREEQNASYITVVQGLAKYEDNNIEYVSESDAGKRILTNPNTGSEFTERFNNQWKSMRNPFKDSYYWLKGELLDLKGLKSALEGRENVVKMQSSTESKKRSDQQELDKLSQGKSTLKTFFKSKSSKESDILTLQSAIEQSIKDVEEFKKLVNFLTVYHGEIAIQKFKREKSKGYLRVLLQLASKEITNSHLAATLWHEVVGMLSSAPK